MHTSSAFRVSRVAGAIIALVVSVAASTAAQSPIPSGSPLPSPPASPQATANPNGWLPVRFVGGSSDVMTVTSDCGIPGVDTFHLTGVGPGTTGWFEVTLTDYDAANLRYTGREVGQVFGQNNTVWEIDDEVSMSYDPGSGIWALKGTWIDMAPIEACAPASPAAT